MSMPCLNNLMINKSNSRFNNKIHQIIIIITTKVVVINSNNKIRINNSSNSSSRIRIIYQLWEIILREY